jgi:hypothetical protein
MRPSSFIHTCALLWATLTTAVTSVSAMNHNQLVLNAASLDSDAFIIASNGRAAPILLESGVDESVKIAVETFADDVERVSGTRPKVFTDTLPSDEANPIIVKLATKDSIEARDQVHFAESDQKSLHGKWESYRMKVETKSDQRSLVVTGSDKVSFPKCLG